MKIIIKSFKKEFIRFPKSDQIFIKQKIIDFLQGNKNVDIKKI